MGAVGSTRSVEGDALGLQQVPRVAGVLVVGPAEASGDTTVSGQDAWVLPFQMFNGASITDAELRLTNQPADLSGKLIDSNDKPVPNFTVVLFPTDKSFWMSNSSRVNRTTRSSAAGTFSFPLTVPGEYYLAVLTELDTADWP